MHSADRMDLLDKWDPEFEDVGTLSLDEIYQELSRLDAFERFISSKQGQNGPDNPDKEVNDDTNAGKDGEDNPETRQKTVLRDINTRRIALRAGAMELSRAKIRPTTIVDLPADILLQIFGYFQDSRIGRRAQIDWRSPARGCEEDIARKTARETIRQIRLVCSLFNDLASPLLCPILRVDLDQESMNGAVELCKRPRIAQGVHAIQVGLQYRPEELVSDCSRFKDYFKLQLDEVAHRCDWLWGNESDDETEGREDLREYREATRNHDKVRSSWDAYFHSDESDENDENDDVAEAEADEHMGILVRGYNEYCKKHEEQLQLITSGSFVTMLARCISQLPNTVTLGFTDEMEPLYDRNNWTILMRDMSLLPGMMSAALQWEKIDNLRHGNDLLTRDAKLTPARILFDLPVAIHKSGIKLRYLDLGPFPCRSSFSLLCPETVSNPTDSAAWSALRAACSSLWRVEFKAFFQYRYIRYEHLRPDEKHYVDQYLSTVLCSADLKTVSLNLYSFGLNDGRTTMQGWYDISPVLSAVNWPRVERISISNVSSKQDELESFCSGLGPSTRRLSLRAIHLLDGSWEGILRTLDEKMRSTFLEQNVRVYLSDLTGGEFGEVEIRERTPLFGFEDSDDEVEPPKPPPAAGELLKKQYAPFFSIW
ncbi:uncharacterized protein NFIA_026080 [Aspergillus fischeri NRRL 181]|uniref:F-box domain-containing protein n=1 Tax=Neosartorya fischeri (strain ATCC 1020 / DSM 3700 / CBS 544.65 / FGSC A1164 / JCM 1740 / NRRL 181 / WB 181) TaxID=331117 RepID=A1DCH4_NEOFI|nr:conserved hypothetical protein [Aspergillus fischeri NRRL 181]EAW19534.1 conserved hypothetical protein [Aspergillus fischeri NRRL 181]KAG2021782.1 hypothetical protein GB937_004328 [Aspergillus fischeri]